MGLVGSSLANGSLRKAGGTPWTEKQLCEDYTHVSPKTLGDILKWLEAEGWLVSAKGSWTGAGRSADTRSLTVPMREFTSSTLPYGPSGNNRHPNGENPAIHEGISATPSGNGKLDHSINSLSSLVSLNTLGKAARPALEVLKEIREKAKAG